MERMSFERAQARADRDTRTLGAECLRQVRRGPLEMAVQDFGGSLSRLKLAGAALALWPFLGVRDDEERVGILLPPGRGGTVMNLAAALAGRTAVNLNHTIGQAQLTRMCEVAELRTVVSSRVYVERIGPLELPGRTLYAEDLLGNLGKLSVLWAMLKVLLLPASWLDRSEPTQVAALVFSSGSMGEPKGVQLTHQQILANCDAVMEHLELHPGKDVVLTPLPLFHVFGLGPGMWLSLVKGFTIAAQADPRDGQALGKLAEATEPTLLISAPTFVRGYMRRVKRRQFASLRFAVVGAEACPHELVETFEERYGVPLYEGYGTTELSPVVSVNSPAANRVGSVGRPLPGVEVLTVDPRTEEILPTGERGLLVVRSPARMLGYLGQDDLSRKVFVHGGYNTGDVGWVDEDSFVYLTGRLARFAKVGGEMVPLDNVESALQRYLDEHHDGNGLVAVVAVGDSRRGERLVVLHDELPCSTEELLSALGNLPPVFKPKRTDVFQVQNIPLLGSGKRDMGATKELARQLTREASDSAG